jgi:hypothetical protein
VCAQFGVDNRARHRALGDADCHRARLDRAARPGDRARVETVGDLLDLQEQPTRRKRRRRRRPARLVLRRAGTPARRSSCRADRSRSSASIRPRTSRSRSRRMRRARTSPPTASGRSRSTRRRLRAARRRCSAPRSAAGRSGTTPCEAVLLAAAILLAARARAVGVPRPPRAPRACRRVRARQRERPFSCQAPVGAVHRAVLEVGLDAAPALLVPGHARSVLAVLCVLAPLAAPPGRRLAA